MVGICGIKKAVEVSEMPVGRFTKEELEEMATYLGCEYIAFFQFKDGTKI